MTTAERQTADRSSARTTGAPPRLRISLPGIAALAGVQRPVVSVWRTRASNYSSGARFPLPVAERGGAELFDAHEVAAWLVETGHGNNPNALGDMAAFAMAPEFVPGAATGFDRSVAGAQYE
ncbi:hypothetical protein [Subtercola boreus]|uniref:Uncharacterized protein n=1 Tax=Subtercola boreus TaxID=120213 RepID=A0A3E0WDS8_9MICO|nr:hypothetical protein [Subtercola boreus]RFA22778.1 hypothetical protein B7R24_04030 [Subtercola boreus]RFA23133.1 hypothetical protein B7R23_04025 [Subtercola boreus]RFA28886.1 hypothetical protein B7R25_04040 [Subtercola boreus]